jgi:hypothetical protein
MCVIDIASNAESAGRWEREREVQSEAHTANQNNGSCFLTPRIEFFLLSSLCIHNLLMFNMYIRKQLLWGKRAPSQRASIVSDNSETHRHACVPCFVSFVREKREKPEVVRMNCK